MGYVKDRPAFLTDGFEPAWLLMKYLTNNRFAEQSYHFSSLFSFLSSLEKVAEGNGEKSEERREKSEENKKKKPLTRLFLFGGPGGIPGLRTGLSAALTPHRGVIHSRSPSNPTAEILSSKSKRRQKPSFRFWWTWWDSNPRGIQ